MCERVSRNGEPGFAWLENMKKYSRMGDAPDGKDHRAAGGNPCLEQVGTLVRSLSSFVCVCALSPARLLSLRPSLWLPLCVSFSVCERVSRAWEPGFIRVCRTCVVCFVLYLHLSEESYTLRDTC